MPVDGATTCPSYAGYTVGLSDSGTKTLQGPLENCSPLTVTRFVPGFNGLAPSGEVVGTALACHQTRSPSSGLGPVVQVNAWSGRNLADFALVFAAPHSTKRYQLVLKPGRYRIASLHSPSRYVEVRASKVVQLGLYGACSSPTTHSTIPGRGATGATTSTTL